VAAAPTFVGSRTLTFTSAPIKLLSPAGARAGDVLICAWLSGPASSQALASDWVELGRTSGGDPNNGGVTQLLVGYHVLSETESDDTTYTFDGSTGEVALMGYRNASTKQPVTPVTVAPIQSDALGGGRASIDVPALQTRGASLPLFVFALIGSTTFPVIAGFERLEATTNLAVYDGTAALPAVNVAGPHLEITVAGPAPSIMVGSLAVVAR